MLKVVAQLPTCVAMVFARADFPHPNKSRGLILAKASSPGCFPSQPGNIFFVAGGVALVPTQAQLSHGFRNVFVIFFIGPELDAGARTRGENLPHHRDGWRNVSPGSPADY